MAKKAAIKYRSLKTNLVHLPLSLYAPLVQQQTVSPLSFQKYNANKTQLQRPQSLIINLKHLPTHPSKSPRATQVSLGWSGLASASSLEMYGSAGGKVETIEMDPEVASGLGWREGDMVEVGIVRQAARGRSVSVTPATSDDWEVLVS
jgi:peroxin-1